MFAGRVRRAYGSVVSARVSFGALLELSLLHALMSNWPVAMDCTCNCDIDGGLFRPMSKSSFSGFCSGDPKNCVLKVSSSSCVFAHSHAGSSLRNMRNASTSTDTSLSASIFVIQSNHAEYVTHVMNPMGIWSGSTCPRPEMHGRNTGSAMTRKSLDAAAKRATPEAASHTILFCTESAASSSDAQSLLFTYRKHPVCIHFRVRVHRCVGSKSHGTQSNEIASASSSLSVFNATRRAPESESRSFDRFLNNEAILPSTRKTIISQTNLVRTTLITRTRRQMAKQRRQLARCALHTRCAAPCRMVPGYDAAARGRARRTRGPCRGCHVGSWPARHRAAAPTCPSWHWRGAARRPRCLR